MERLCTIHAQASVEQPKSGEFKWTGAELNRRHPDFQSGPAANAGRIPRNCMAVSLLAGTV
jgi:hypothetical protein